MQKNNGFHNTVDSQVRSFQNWTGSVWKAWNVVTTLNRSVTYQFSTHFHPYVLNLIQNLNNGGIDELQATDTIYAPDTPSQPNSGTPLTVQANSTRATLLQTVGGTLVNGSSISLTPGTPLTLLDGAAVTVASQTSVLNTDGTQQTLTAPLTVTLPGQIPISGPSGIQVTGSNTVVADGTTVTVANGTQVVLANDGTVVTLTGATTAAIRRGLPQPYLFDQAFFAADYDPQQGVVAPPYPVKDLDFTVGGAYAIYNWEIFFHVPLLIAVHLSQNQKFQDAQNWFHYIFNPTDNSDGPTPQRFWRVQPFQSTDVETIQEILVNLSTGADPQLQSQTVQCIQNWKNQPFQPWAVAQFRPTAYMFKTVMAYLDNLIAWGDSLFQQYTIETINEATQIYILAANILGPKPQAVPITGPAKPLTYAQLRGNLNAFSDTMEEVETDIPFDMTPLPNAGTNPPGTQILPSLGQTLYFCVPQNDQLLAYWDTVATRLFNIHNSLNLQGVYQQLPLYDPPIDPALLVRAAADGLDVSAIVSGLNQPLPLVRFRLLIAKALEISQEVQSLGAGLLSAMEKQDNESLSLLRSQHESAVLSMAQMVKYSQWQDATKARQALEQTFNNAAQRYTYYQQLLGQSPADVAKNVPQLDAVDTSGLQSFNFSQQDETGEPQLTPQTITMDIAKDPTQVSDGEQITISNKEVEELTQLASAQSAHSTASTFDKIGGVLAVIPNFSGNIEPFGCGCSITFGGSNLAAAMSATSNFYKSDAESDSYQATNAAKLGSYDRRQDEWTFQSNTALGEINQTYKQWRGAQIREAIANQEYLNHLAQMQQAQDIVTFLQGQALTGTPVKETTVDFYTWMKRETKSLYASAFQLAFEVAKKAERALQNELGDSSRSYIQYNYLDGTEGLLAGEKLMFDLKTMEMAYHDLNQREYELTKQVSLLQAAPLALIQLRATGSCLVTLPEALFDLDGPGHYFRRVKSVALTIPCVTGPYTSVNCTLSLQKSSIRTSTDVSNGYARAGANDSRFDDYYGAMQAIVTSAAQSDSGLFETNLNDDRYLPFEAVGVAGSQWQLTLPSDVPQFDFDTITDVVLHVRYTAREGGESMRAAAVQNLQSLISKAQTIGSVRLFSVRHEFPAEWAKFQSAPTPTNAAPAPLSLPLLAQHYPFWFLSVANAALQQMQLFAEMTDKATSFSVFTSPTGGSASDNLAANPAYGAMVCGPLTNAVKSITQPTGVINLYFNDNAMSDLWLAITWKGKFPAA